MGKKVAQERKSRALVQSGVKVSPSTNKPHLGKRKATLAKTIISNDYSSGKVLDPKITTEIVFNRYKKHEKKLCIFYNF